MNLIRDALGLPRRRPALTLVVALQVGLIVAGAWAVTNARAPGAHDPAVVLSPGDDASSEFVSVYAPASDGAPSVTTSLLGTPAASVQLSLFHIENRRGLDTTIVLHASGLRSGWVSGYVVQLTGKDGQPRGSLPLASAPRELAITVRAGEVVEARTHLTLSPDAPEEGLPVLVEFSVRELAA